MCEKSLPTRETNKSNIRTNMHLEVNWINCSFCYMFPFFETTVEYMILNIIILFSDWQTDESEINRPSIQRCALRVLHEWVPLHLMNIGMTTKKNPTTATNQTNKQTTTTSKQQPTNQQWVLHKGAPMHLMNIGMTKQQQPTNQANNNKIQPTKTETRITRKHPLYKHFTSLQDSYHARPLPTLFSMYMCVRGTLYSSTMYALDWACN